MSDPIVQQASTTPTTETNGVTPPAPVADDTPQTPGEAAKEVRLRGELHARQARLKKQTDEFHKSRAAFEDERKSWAEQRAKADEESKKVIDELRSEIKQLKEGNPLTRMSGEQANAVLREFVDSGAPEVQIKKLEKAIADRDAAFEAYKKEQQTAAERRQADEERARTEAQKGAEQQQFRGLVQQVFTMKGEDGVPAFRYICAEMTPSGLFAEVSKIVEAGKALRWIDKDGTPRVGKFYTGQEIADYLEKVCEKSYNDRMSRIQGLGLMGAPAAPNPAAKGSKPTASPPAKGNGSSGGNKFQSRQLTKAEEEREDRDALKKAMAKDRAAFEASKRK